MVQIDYNSPLALKNFLEERGMAMQKKFGQNFLVNPQARKRIVTMLDIAPGEAIWEIGPGLGCMTREILDQKANLKAFEIDRGFISILNEIFSGEINGGNFKIISGDVLKTWQQEAQNEKPVKLFGNLPYNIASTFIADTIEHGFAFDRCVFTVQKEVAQRICASHSSKNYSSFSVLCQWQYDVSLGAEISAGNFWPRPNVASQTVLLVKKDSPLECSNPKFLVKLIHALFSSRRKTVLNNIKQMLPPGLEAVEVLEKASIDKNMRAENLTVADYVRLSETCTSAIM
ncbi:MAG: ribosomal RNA small subunit methyltransferase A [Treponema sp.]|nr:ribosomal RNA small subunit methyltransferase A [Treponema sp.]